MDAYVPLYEFYPLVIELIHIKLGHLPKKRFYFSWRWRVRPDNRCGDFATSKRVLFVQFNSIIITIAQGWNPIPKWSRDFLINHTY